MYVIIRPKLYICNKIKLMDGIKIHICNITAKAAKNIASSNICTRMHLIHNHYRTFAHTIVHGLTHWSYLTSQV
jgi:hypothetical protein